MISYTDQARSCVVCGKEFDDASDVVFCPDCGAPHHRACWQEEGHCHYEAAHGTDLQWHPKEPPRTAPEVTPPEPDDPPAPRVIVNGIAMTRCPNCGRYVATETEPVCPACGHAFHGDDPEAARQAAEAAQPLDGATVGKLRRIVLQRWQYYIPRFQALKKQGRKYISWNWAAFLLAPYWFAFRKCYLWALFASFFDVLSMLLMYPMTHQVMNFITANNMTYSQAMEYYLLNGSFTPQVVLLAQGALLLLLVRAVVFGLLGNYIYKKECLRRIERLDAMPPEEAGPMAFRLSGVNIFAPILVYYLISLAQSLLSGLI